MTIEGDFFNTECKKNGGTEKNLSARAGLLATAIGKPIRLPESEIATIIKSITDFIMQIASGLTGAETVVKLFNQSLTRQFQITEPYTGDKVPFNITLNFTGSRFKVGDATIPACAFGVPNVTPENLMAPPEPYDILVAADIFVIGRLYAVGAYTELFNSISDALNQSIPHEITHMFDYIHSRGLLEKPKALRTQNNEQRAINYQNNYTSVVSEIKAYGRNFYNTGKLVANKTFRDILKKRPSFVQSPEESGKIKNTEFNKLKQRILDKDFLIPEERSAIGSFHTTTTTQEARNKYMQFMWRGFSEGWDEEVAKAKSQAKPVAAGLLKTAIGFPNV